VISARPIDRISDATAVRAIDTAFEPPSIFTLALTQHRLELVETSLPTPRTKRYAIAELFAPWCTWDRGWVVEDPSICAIAAVDYEAWHRRLVLTLCWIAGTKAKMNCPANPSAPEGVAMDAR